MGHVGARAVPVSAQDGLVHARGFPHVAAVMEEPGLESWILKFASATHQRLKVTTQK